MNIEIANRLVNLRKDNNLSQEALAEKLGISRQAVSKWERAEASPDTDNLILLARLYGVSLDSLLQTEDEIPVIEEMPEEEAVQEQEVIEEEESKEYVKVGFGGIHVKDKDGSEVHVGWDGIHVDDKKNRKDTVHIDKNGIYVNGEEYDKSNWGFDRHQFPFDILIITAYIVIGLVWNAWHPGWLIFFAIPIWHSLVAAVRNKNMHIFSYPVVALFIFFALGIFKGMWHPGWVVFLTIPIYYSLVAYVRGLKKEKNI